MHGYKKEGVCKGKKSTKRKALLRKRRRERLLRMLFELLDIAMPEACIP